MSDVIDVIHNVVSPVTENTVEYFILTDTSTNSLESVCLDKIVDKTGNEITMNNQELSGNGQSKNVIENKVENLVLTDTSNTTLKSVCLDKVLGSTEDEIIENNRKLSGNGQSENVSESNINERVASDETFEHLCRPCLAIEAHMESKMYCVQCDEHLCQNCANYHSRLNITKGHRLIPREDFSEDSDAQINNPPEPCNQHIGQYIEWFCTGHGKLCCQSCKATKHFSCTVISLAEASSGVRTKSDFQTVLQNLTEIDKRLKTVLETRQKDAENLALDKTNALSELDHYADQLKNFIDKLQELDKEKILGADKLYQTFISTDIANCNEAINILGRSRTALQNDKNSDNYVFIQMKHAQDNITNAENVVQSVKTQVGTEMIAYESDMKIKTMVSHFKCLGYINSEKTMFDMNKAVPVELPTASLRLPEVNAIKLNTNGDLLICCTESNVICLSNMNLECLAKEDFKTPFDITEMSYETVTKTQYAVTLVDEMTVQLFRICERKQDAFGRQGLKCFERISSFCTREKCRGIAYHNSQFYVACGGCGISESFGHIRVFTPSGILTKNVLMDVSGMSIIKKPWKITKCPSSPSFYVTDLDNGLLKISEDSRVIQKISQKPYFDIVFLQDNKLLACDYNSGNIDIINLEGQTQETMVRDRKNIKAIAYEKASGKLYMGLANTRSTPNRSSTSQNPDVLQLKLNVWMKSQQMK